MLIVFRFGPHVLRNVQVSPVIKCPTDAAGAMGARKKFILRMRRLSLVTSARPSVFFGVHRKRE